MARVRPAIQFSFTGTRRCCMTEHSFRKRSNLTRPLSFNITTLPGGYRSEQKSSPGSSLSPPLSSCFPVTLQPILTAGRELKNIQPNFVYPLNLKKKKKRPTVCFCLKLAGIITRPHSLLVCLLSFFSPLLIPTVPSLDSKQSRQHSQDKSGARCQ